LRIRTIGNDSISLCPHIELNGKETKEEFPSLEYIENITLHCHVCRKHIEFEVAVN